MSKSAYTLMIIMNLINMGGFGLPYLRKEGRMVNTEELRAIIKESGYKFEYLATRLDISRASLRNKVENITEFKLSEIRALEEILKLEPEQRDSIFFA